MMSSTNVVAITARSPARRSCSCSNENYDVINERRGNNDRRKRPVIQRALMAASLPLAAEELLEKVKEQEFE